MFRGASRCVRNVLIEADWNMSAAAHKLRLTRAKLDYRMTSGPCAGSGATFARSGWRSVTRRRRPVDQGAPRSDRGQRWT
ncbi:helix-turn-helix domain-containing protein, partial [Roseicyclus sp.]|uniref:helix-turn-helix domain-containing protein n=1 Tax=Roseicyclus sp. TaxID=1914329 RepID=UPI003F695906